MKDMENLPDTMFTLAKSTPDSNKFYSILLDTRASTMSENMYDTAEKLLSSEKENAKNALEHLWALKKNMQTKEETATVDLIIQYYQNKIDILRNKEEHIKKISRDSRNLLEDKRKRDAEVATIKQEITDCSRELKDLSAKLEKLKIKEQELTLIESQLKKELVVNENEIVNGLYEIIISNTVEDEPEEGFSEKIQSIDAAVPKTGFAGSGAERPAAKASETAAVISKPAVSPVENRTVASPLPVADKKEAGKDTGLIEILVNLDSKAAEDLPVKEDADVILYKQAQPEQQPVFPKSVVKTTRGRIVGEYYYDAKAYKNKRHYIFNSTFFLDQLANAVNILKQKHNESLYTDLMQMIQDAYSRISENPASMHFEVATNEILNEKTLKKLWQNVKSKDYNEAGRFCRRLSAKLGALGANYRTILKEQMVRYVEKQ